VPALGAGAWSARSEMLDLIARFFGRQSGGSKQLAKERLRLVLVHDRASVSPHFLNMLKADLLQVMNKYLEIDEATTRIMLSRQGNSIALLASIPIKRIRRNLQFPHVQTDG